MNVNWSALGGVLLVALTVGLGTVGLFSLGILAVDRRNTAVADHQPAVLATATSVLCFLAYASVVVYGIYLVVVG